MKTVEELKKEVIEKAFKEGMEAFNGKIDREYNPYYTNPHRFHWFRGWDDAEKSNK